MPEVAYDVTPRTDEAQDRHGRADDGPPPAVPGQRLVSLDALRGFDMFWIIGIDTIIELLAKRPGADGAGPIARSLRFVAAQLQHKQWEGIAFEDLIFPLFVFIVGVSLVFSLSKALRQQTTPRVVLRIVSRAALLYLLGLMVYNGFDQPIHAFAGQSREGPNAMHAVRWLGVLQRIAICYCAAALLFCAFRPRVLVIVTIALLVGYWLLMAYVKVPGVGRGSFAEGANLANYLDQRFLGGYKWDGDHDPEGYLSTLPAIATCLLGVFAGLLLKSAKPSPYAKVGALLLGGAALAGAGYAWGFLPSPVQFPVIKKLWTSSYVLLAGGYSAIILGLFYLVIDVWKLRGWAMPFVWIGTNAITIYMLVELGFVGHVAQRLVGGGHHRWPVLGESQDLVTGVVALVLAIAVCRFLYRKGVFIRV
jgi:predicted acyltransferase